MLVDTFTTPTISIRSIPSSAPAPASASASSSRLYADISFIGDSKATLKFEAPASKVREWLYTPECSDLKQLGASQGTQDPKDLNMWDCQQPAIDFLGLNLQPYFVSRLERQARDYDNDDDDDDDDDDDNDDGTVTVSVVDSRIEILNKNNPAARSVASIMRRAKFTGTRITILVKRVVDDDDDDDDDDNNNNESQCILSVDLTLRLHVPLPPSFFLSFSLYKT